MAHLTSQPAALLGLVFSQLCHAQPACSSSRTFGRVGKQACQIRHYDQCRVTRLAECAALPLRRERRNCLVCSPGYPAELISSTPLTLCARKQAQARAYGPPPDTPRTKNLWSCSWSAKKSMSCTITQPEQNEPKAVPPPPVLIDRLAARSDL